MRYGLIFLVVLVAGIGSACQRLPNIQGRGEAVLQGIWGQERTPNADKLLNYTEHSFKFSCDSFYVDLTTYSKVNYYEDSCFNKGVWREYAKGVYALRDDSLFLEGTYTRANYKQKISGCYHNGRYIKSFLVKKASDNRIILRSLANHRTFTLFLKEQTICIPKEL